MTNLERWMFIYTCKLAEIRQDADRAVVWPVADCQTIAEHMRPAFLTGVFDKDTRAIRATCEVLDLPHTNDAIHAYIHGPIVPPVKRGLGRPVGTLRANKRFEHDDV